MSGHAKTQHVIIFVVVCFFIFDLFLVSSNNLVLSKASEAFEISSCQRNDKNFHNYVNFHLEGELLRLLSKVLPFGVHLIHSVGLLSSLFTP